MKKRETDTWEAYLWFTPGGQRGSVLAATKEKCHPDEPEDPGGPRLVEIRKKVWRRKAR